MGCCLEYTKIGCFDSCSETFDLGFKADVAGLWSINISVFGGNSQAKINYDLNEQIIVPNVGFNEHASHVITLTRPDGTVFKSCLLLKTKIIKKI